ncbi:MAG TPA: LysR family transcriptional regulator [Candidatus Ozemobacteraceae bacterium]|mgnify:CR=1 FL=1|nr:LysR family transcriptional regulator [Candidatus Ozemobacteraceae bacterium]
MKPPQQESFDLQQLWTFFVAASSRTFTEASERLHISQSAVSHAVRKLERSAGFALIIRDRAPLQLTEPGRLLFETCGRIFPDLRRCREMMHQSASNDLVGRMRVGATVEFGNSILARGMAPFLQKYPQLEMEFTFSHDLLKPLLADELDLIIDCRGYTRKGISRKTLFREKYVLVAAPELLNAAKVKRLSDLNHLIWLTLDSDGDWWQRFLAQLPPDVALSPRRLLPVNHLRGLINMAATGVGIALVPAYCVQSELRQGCLKMLFPDVQIREDRFFLYCKSYREAEPKLVSFTKFVKGLSLESH